MAMTDMRLIVGSLNSISPYLQNFTKITDSSISKEHPEAIRAIVSLITTLSKSCPDSIDLFLNRTDAILKRSSRKQGNLCLLVTNEEIEFRIRQVSIYCISK